MSFGQWLSFNFASRKVIPKARAFTSGPRACPEQVSVANASNGDLPYNEASGQGRSLTPPEKRLRSG
jgi:hypothetical protein